MASELNRRPISLKLLAECAGTEISRDLVQHSGRFNGRTMKDWRGRFTKNGMAESFQASHDSLCDDGRMVIVFAHKDPTAWETLVNSDD